MESSANDRDATGSYNFGQYEVLVALSNAGYAVGVNEQPRLRLTRYIVDNYGLIVLNGRYGARTTPPIPPEVVDNLVGYVNDGGNLLVVAGGGRVSRGEEPQFYNALLTRFGLRFREGVTLPRQHLGGSLAGPLGAGEPAAFHWSWGVPVETAGGEVLGYAGAEPVIAAVRFGRGKVVAAGLGSGFMGQCLNVEGRHARPDVASANTALLLRLAQYLLQS